MGVRRRPVQRRRRPQRLVLRRCVAERRAYQLGDRMSAIRKRDPEAFLAKLWWLEAQLVARRFPAMSPHHRAMIERWERAGKRRRVWRKGRQVGASTIAAPRLAVAEMLFGQ